MFMCVATCPLSLYLLSREIRSQSDDAKLLSESLCMFLCSRCGFIGRDGSLLVQNESGRPLKKKIQQQRAFLHTALLMNKNNYVDK